MPSDPPPHTRFDAAADAYSRARPGYPDEAVRWLLGACGLAPGDPVLDVGAGTGALTAPLLGAGLAVTALEPSAGMRRHLEERLPEAEARPGRIEDLDMPDGSFRLATAANAYHWLDPASALPAIHRLLAPGGHFAIVWNLPVFEHPSHRLLESLDHSFTNARFPGTMPDRPHEWHGLFAPAAEHEVALPFSLPAERVREYVASWSGMANLDRAEREPSLRKVRGWFPEGEVELPFRVVITLARRLQPADSPDSPG